MQTKVLKRKGKSFEVSVGSDYAAVMRLNLKLIRSRPDLYRQELLMHYLDVINDLESVGL